MVQRNPGNYLRERVKGSPLVLDVEVEGKPKEVQWSREGSPLDRDSGAIPEDLGNGHYRLSIPDLANDGDFGRYSVKVSNDAGQAESAANVKEAGRSGKKEEFKEWIPGYRNYGNPPEIDTSPRLHKPSTCRIPQIELDKFNIFMRLASANANVHGNGGVPH